ncbi:recombinase family protein [Kaistia nematophila]
MTTAQGISGPTTTTSRGSDPVRVALYGRYSSDMQSASSISDQFRICRDHAARLGWTIIEEYSDHAISGSSMLRPGIQALMSDAIAGRFDIVLSEALDRISRDQEDIAGFFKRMMFSSVRMVTLAEGEINQLHIGLKGTMNALFLKDLADKTRRGQRGRVEADRSGGGNCYGYDVVLTLGDADRGKRTINAAEAEVVRRIFRQYAIGQSPMAIASALNAAGVAGPRGGEWSASTINGNRKRGIGILNNELYRGQLIWNRQRFLKDPISGKRIARENPETEWIIRDRPDLRIVSDEEWQTVRDRQESLTREDFGQKPLNARKRAKYLLSGLLVCGECGANYAVSGRDHLQCSRATNKGTCANRRLIRRSKVERAVLDGLRFNLLEMDAFQEFCDTYVRETNRLQASILATIQADEAEIAKIDRDLGRLVDAVLAGTLSDDVVRERSQKLEARKTILADRLAGAKRPPPALHPRMADNYRKQIEEFYEQLQDETAKPEAMAHIRSLVERIEITIRGDEVILDVVGELAGILTIAANEKAPAVKAGAYQVMLVAGTRFELMTFRL